MVCCRPIPEFVFERSHWVSSLAPVLSRTAEELRSRGEQQLDARPSSRRRDDDARHRSSPPQARLRALDLAGNALAGPVPPQLGAPRAAHTLSEELALDGYSPSWFTQEGWRGP